MTKQTLKRRIDALENDISEVDADTRKDMISRLERMVLTLGFNGSVPRSTVGRHRQQSQEEAEDFFDNMPI
ncbi:hypothetical protein [Puniceibacterium sediminis]|uniref:Uncharacterized protein n=1 Tax=Puniceibacterium sediminis TaxID=1608407 RepID=A0A238XMD7_9RHOB|nr:hypothetical protein [Puniceibacterium sediminis]SNR59731.1 hypothetical protein SAMN06265370_11219 [Puniceibacterium sediminis]